MGARLQGGTPACSHFSVAAPYTECLELGAAATHYEGKLVWDNREDGIQQ